MTLLSAGLIALSACLLLCCAICARCIWIMRERVERTYRQIANERMDSAQIQQRMLDVLTDAGEHDLAWACLEAAPERAEAPLA